MNALQFVGEYLLGLLILLVTLLCIFVAGLVSIFEIPNYLRHTRQ